MDQENGGPLRDYSRIEARANELIKRANRLRADKERKGNKKGRQLENQLMPLFSFIAFERDDPWPLEMDNIFHGVANLDWYRSSAGGKEGVSGTTGNYRQVPLSKSSLRKIFTFLPLISTEEVRKLLLIDDRQASRYMKAALLAYPKLCEFKENFYEFHPDQ